MPIDDCRPPSQHTQHTTAPNPVVSSKNKPDLFHFFAYVRACVHMYIYKKHDARWTMPGQGEMKMTTVPHQPSTQVTPLAIAKTTAYGSKGHAVGHIVGHARTHACTHALTHARTHAHAHANVTTATSRSHCCVDTDGDRHRRRHRWRLKINFTIKLQRHSLAKDKNVYRHVHRHTRAKLEAVCRHAYRHVCRHYF